MKNEAMAAGKVEPKAAGKGEVRAAGEDPKPRVLPPALSASLCGLRLSHTQRSCTSSRPRPAPAAELETTKKHRHINC